MVIKMRLFVLLFFAASVSAGQLPEPGLAQPAIVPPLPVFEQPKLIQTPTTYYQTAPVTTYYYPPVTTTYYRTAPVTTYYYPPITRYIPPRLNYYPMPSVQPILIRR
jgi:hypothetical protein